jgi:hypothetical protein
MDSSGCTLVTVSVAVTGPLNWSSTLPGGTPFSTKRPAASSPEEIDVPATVTTNPGTAWLLLADVKTLEDPLVTLPAIEAPPATVPGAVGAALEPPHAALTRTKKSGTARGRLVIRQG